jgi:putative ABC transport system ATP-binding protein
MTMNSNPNSPLLSATDLHKWIEAPSGSLHILQGIDLNLHPGEVTAILGASGSGKSTLLGLLAGLDQASSGEILLFGQNLSEMDEDSRARLRAGQVGFVFQSFQLLPGMTALENVMLPLELAGVDNPADGGTRFLQQVGLEQRLHHYPDQLSGGEQQRVAIARAFAGGPKLLFADEPTGSLDQENGRRISDLLFDMREHSGAALLLVTHDEHLASRCDHRLHLDQGRLEPCR